MGADESSDCGLESTQGTGPQGLTGPFSLSMLSLNVTANSKRYC